MTEQDCAIRGVCVERPCHVESVTKPRAVELLGKRGLRPTRAAELLTCQTGNLDAAMQPDGWIGCEVSGLTSSNSSPAQYFHVPEIGPRFSMDLANDKKLHKLGTTNCRYHVATQPALSSARYTADLTPNQA